MRGCAEAKPRSNPFDEGRTLFPSHGESCAAWHLTGEGDAFAGEHGRPCVVMAHGLGATKDSGLLPFAEAFAGAGLDVLLFDYRCFGESTGEPRQLAWPARHREDYAAAVEFARGLDGVDPERIVLWGTSWSGGHVVYVGADDSRIAAVISQTPDLDGVRTLREIGKYAGLGQQLRVTLVGIKDALRMRRGEEPLMLATVGRPGELAAMTSEESEPGMRAIAGPSWRNEVAGRAAFAEWTNRAITRMDKLRCSDPRADRRPGLGCSTGRRARGGLARQGPCRGPRVPMRCTTTSTSANGASARSPTSSTSCGAT